MLTEQLVKSPEIAQIVNNIVIKRTTTAYCSDCGNYILERTSDVHFQLSDQPDLSRLPADEIFMAMIIVILLQVYLMLLMMFPDHTMEHNLVSLGHGEKPNINVICSNKYTRNSTKVHCRISIELVNTQFFLDLTPDKFAPARKGEYIVSFHKLCRENDNPRFI